MDTIYRGPFFSLRLLIYWGYSTKMDHLKACAFLPWSEIHLIDRYQIRPINIMTPLFLRYRFLISDLALSATYWDYHTKFISPIMLEIAHISGPIISNGEWGHANFLIIYKKISKHSRFFVLSIPSCCKITELRIFLKYYLA